MKEVSYNEMLLIKGSGDPIAGLCYGIGGGSILYTAGAMTQFWNPVGWVSVAFLAADAACLAYGLSQAE